MASAAEFTYAGAVIAAEMTRQVSKQAAFVTYGFVQANYPAYIAALAAADVAYITAVNTAMNTLAITLNSGLSGLLGGKIASIGS